MECITCFGLLFGLGLTLIHILICIWIYTDAQRRGMDSPAIWILISLFFPIIGLIIYLLVRK